MTACLGYEGSAGRPPLAEFNKVLSGFKDDATVGLVVLRKGKNETLKGLVLAKAPKDPMGGFGGFPLGGGFPPMGGGGFPPMGGGFPPMGGGFPPMGGGG